LGARSKSNGHLTHSAAGERGLTTLEIRRQNEVLRRLIRHVRTFSPEIGDPLADGESASDEPEPPMAHRRPFAANKHAQE
jgi:hypothetical protein